MENKKKKKKKFFFFFSNWEFFAWNWEKNILFGIGNGAEFRPQNRVIESPAKSPSRDNVYLPAENLPEKS